MNLGRDEKLNAPPHPLSCSPCSISETCLCISLLLPKAFLLGRKGLGNSKVRPAICKLCFIPASDHCSPCQQVPECVLDLTLISTESKMHLDLNFLQVRSPLLAGLQLTKLDSANLPLSGSCLPLGPEFRSEKGMQTWPCLQRKEQAFTKHPMTFLISRRGWLNRTVNNLNIRFGS